MIRRILSLLLCGFAVFMAVNVLIDCRMPITGNRVPRLTTGVLAMTTMVLFGRLLPEYDPAERLIANFLAVFGLLGLGILYFLVDCA